MFRFEAAFLRGPSLLTFCRLQGELQGEGAGIGFDMELVCFAKPGSVISKSAPEINGTGTANTKTVPAT